MREKIQPILITLIKSKPTEEDIHQAQEALIDVFSEQLKEDRKFDILSVHKWLNDHKDKVALVDRSNTVSVMELDSVAYTEDEDGLLIRGNPIGRVDGNNVLLHPPKGFIPTNKMAYVRYKEGLGLCQNWKHEKTKSKNTIWVRVPTIEL